MPGFSFISLFTWVENIKLWWIMGKQNTPGWKISAAIGKNRFKDIDSLVSNGSLISTCLTQWFDLLDQYS